MLPKYKRILLKLSGESLMGDKSFGLDTVVIEQYANDIKAITELGVQVALVIGGGNIYRGMNEKETGIERAHGDYMGMLATVINGMALQAMLEKVKVYTRLQSAIKGFHFLRRWPKCTPASSNCCCNEVLFSIFYFRVFRKPACSSLTISCRSPNSMN